jgi:polyhydroxyalkanoate synthesis regulator phasin
MLAVIRPEGGLMTRIDDARNTIETTLGTLTPAKAQELAKGLLEPDARKEQVAKAVGDLLEWSQRNRQRMRDLIRREIREQLEQVGVASRADVDALKKRVRELERRAGMTASGRRASASGGAPAGAKRATPTKKSSAKSTAKPTAKTAATSTAKSTTATPAAPSGTASTTDTPRSTGASAEGTAGPTPSASNPAANG